MSIGWYGVGATVALIAGVDLLVITFSTPGVQWWQGLAGGFLVGLSLRLVVVEAVKTVLDKGTKYAIEAEVKARHR